MKIFKIVAFFSMQNSGSQKDLHQMQNASTGKEYNAGSPSILRMSTYILVRYVTRSHTFLSMAKTEEAFYIYKKICGS
jgi:hypothetical protein